MRAFTDQDELIREKTFLLMVPLFAIAGLLWACIYYYYGAKTASMIPGIYGVTSFLFLFIICVVLIFFLEERSVVTKPYLPDQLVFFFFALNISAVTILMFFLLRYFVNQNDRVKEKLKYEQVQLAIEQEKSER